MGKLGLRAKLAIGFSVLLATLIVLGGMAYTAIRKVTSATEEANLSLNKKELATLLEVGVRKQIQSANDNVFNGDAASWDRYGKSAREVQQTLDELGKMLSHSEDKAMLAKFVQSAKQITILTDQQIDFRRQSRTYEATDLAFGPKEEEAIKEVADDAAKLGAWEDKLAQQGLDAQHRTKERAGLFT